LVVLDFETFFADDYTLSRLSTEHYIRDERFQAHGAAIKWSPSVDARWYDEPQLRWVLAQEDWSDVALVAWHAQFDGLILSHQYDVHPKLLICPMAMFRMLHGTWRSAALDKVRGYFGLAPKTTPYNAFRGYHWSEMSTALRQQVAEGCQDEVESIYKLFGMFAKDFPLEEYDVLDETLKMFTEPVLRADRPLLRRIWETEEGAKSTRAANLGIDPAELQSAERFAALLEAEGVEIEYKAGKNGPIPAFAKTDDFMRDLLDDTDDRVRALAEARLGEKSTIMQTRAATLGWMASRGPLCVYLNYSGAGTLRPSGGDKTNFLNMKRQSPIRRALLAPEGYWLAPIDAAQIECRVLHYLAGGPDEPVLQKFRNHEDPYADIATKFYGEPIYKPKADDPRKAEMEAKRGMGKQGRLMCLAADTVLLTSNGFKPIVSVLQSDLLWDGVEWVTHLGLISQGEQNVVDVAGVRMTSDHQILSGNTWVEAAECLRAENILSRALVTGSANLPSPAMNSDRGAAFNTSSLVAAAMRRNIRSFLKICTAVAPLAVDVALKLSKVFGLNNTTGMPIFVPTRRIGVDCLAEFPRYTIAARPDPSIMHTKTMVGAASRFTPRGAMIAEHSWHICSRFQAGINRSWRLIEKIIKAVMCPATFILQLAERIRKTSENSAISKMKLPTYDIACSGPRHRFTIVSSVGPLIVHNCGYGAGAKQFKKTAKNGLYGPPVDMSIEDATEFVRLYREDTPSVCAPRTGYWAQANKMIARLAGGEPLQWGPLLVKDHRLYLPNGCCVVYDTLEYHVPEEGEPCREHERGGYWRVRTRQGWKAMWGSKLVQNICEAVSRVIVTQAMVRIRQMGIRTLSYPYDELLLLIPKGPDAERTLAACKREMTREVAWLPGLPLDCEGELGDCYEK
jgi:hypothetical protein